MCVAIGARIWNPDGVQLLCFSHPPVAPSGRPGATNMEPIWGSKNSAQAPTTKPPNYQTTKPIKRAYSASTSTTRKKPVGEAAGTDTVTAVSPSSAAVQLFKTTHSLPSAEVHCTS